MTKELQHIAEAAAAAEKQTGCPAELLVAQCALESGWLQHAPAFNCFGIKQYPGCYGTQMLATTEWFTDSQRRQFIERGEGRSAILKRPNEPKRADGRREYFVRDVFATFPSLEACFLKRCQIWDKGPYSRAADHFKKGGDFETFVREIGPIYATDPAYATEVLKISNQSDVQAALAAARAMVPTT